MPTTTRRTSSSANTPDQEPGRADRGIAKPAHKLKVLPSDADARRAMEWMKRAQPQAEVVYDEVAPKQTWEELARFRPVPYRRSKKP